MAIINHFVLVIVFLSGYYAVLFFCPMTYFRCPEAGCVESPCSSTRCGGWESYFICELDSSRRNSHDEADDLNPVHSKRVETNGRSTICREDHTEPFGTISYMSRDRDKFFCEWVITTVDTHIIILDVFDFASINDYESCNYYPLQIFDTNLIRLAKHCIPHSNSSYVYSSIGKMMTIHFAIASYAPIDRTTGFNASYVTQAKIWCGGSFAASQIGVIQIPDHGPGTLYADTIDCTWSINTLTDSVVLLWFIGMNVDDENVNTCENRYLKIFDGNFLTDTICRAENAKEIESITNVVTMVLHSQASVQLDGFGVVYRPKQIDPAQNRECGGVLTRPVGLIQSYGFNYCVWVLVAPDRKQIFIEFLHLTTFSCDASKPCYIELYDGSFDYTASLGRYCTLSFLKDPRTIFSKTNVLYIEFVHSDGFSRNADFKAKYHHKDPMCCETYMTVIAGSFQSQDGNFSVHSNCTWIIQVPATDIRIELYIFYFVFDAVSYGECSSGRVKIYDDIKVYKELCGTNDTGTVRSSSNVLYVNFVRNSEVTSRSFSAFYTTVGVYLTFETSKSIVKTIPPGLAMSTWYTSTPTQTSTDHNEPQDRQTAETSACGGLLTSSTDRRTVEFSSFYHNTSYQNEVHCVWLIIAPVGLGVMLDFIQLDQSVPWKSNAIIKFHDGEFNSDLELLPFDRLPPSARTISNALFLEADFGNADSRNWFIASYKQYGDDDLCGETSFAGIITSIDKDGNGFYDDNISCTWEIRAAKAPRQYVELTFVNISLEISDYCQKDFVRVFDTRSFHGVYCEPTNIPFYSTYGELFVDFRSDDSIHNIGFMGVYAVIDSWSNCGGVMLHEIGVITTGFEPRRHYDPNTDCAWTIMASETWRIKVIFENMCIEWESYCQYDYLEIYDGSYSASGLERRVCGTSLPKPIWSLTNTLYLVFHSDESHECSGFVAYYTMYDGRSCEPGDLSAQGRIFIAGLFHSVDRDLNGYYDNSINCFWRVSLPVYASSNLIEICLYDVDIPSNDYCSSDRITVYDDYITYGVYCGRIDREIIRSTTSTLYVAFITDNSVSGRGFTVIYTTVDIITPNNANTSMQLNVNWAYFSQSDHRLAEKIDSDWEDTNSMTTVSNRAVSPFVMTTLSMYIYGTTCGGISTFPTGTIKSVDKNFDGMYDHDLHCVWIIAAPPGITISFTFIQFQLYGECGDYVLLHDGQYNDSATTDNALCGTSSPLPMETTTSILFVEFFTNTQFAAPGFRAKYSFLEALKTRTTRSRVESTKLSSSVRTTEISTLAYDTTPETYMTGQTPESSMHTLGTTAIYTFLTTFTIMYSTFEKTTGLVGTSNLRLWSGLQSTTDPNELSTVPFKTDLTTSTQTFKQGASETTSRETDGETHSVKITTLENSSSIGGWHRKQTSAIRALTATSRDNSNDTARPTNVDPTQTIKPIDQHQTSTFTDNHMNAVDDASTPKMSSYMYYLQLYIALAVFI